MRKIDIGKIINQRGLDSSEVANLLFPKHAHPKRALTRVIEGKSSLDSQQLSKFALYVGLTMNQLFNGGWKNASIVEGVYSLENGEFKAELNTDEWTTKIFHNKSLFHEEVIHSKSITLTDYIALINHNISKFSKS